MSGSPIPHYCRINLPNSTPTAVGDLAVDSTGRPQWYNGSVQKCASEADALVSESQSTPIASGHYLLPTGMTTMGTRAFTNTDDANLNFQRIDVQPYAGISIQGYVIGITAAQSGGSVTTRWAIYNDNGSGNGPTGSPVSGTYTAGTALTSTGDRITAASFTLARGVYWIGFGYHEATAPTTRATARSLTGGLSVSINALSNFPILGWGQSGWSTFTSMPAVGTLTNKATPMMLGLQLT